MANMEYGTKIRGKIVSYYYSDQGSLVKYKHPSMPLDSQGTAWLTTDSTCPISANAGTGCLYLNRDGFYVGRGSHDTLNFYNGRATTLSMWIRHIGWGGSLSYNTGPTVDFVYGSSGSRHIRSYYRWYSDGQIWAIPDAAGPANRLFTNGFLWDSNWHHVAICATGSVFRIFGDGNLLFTSNNTQYATIWAGMHQYMKPFCANATSNDTILQTYIQDCLLIHDCCIWTESFTKPDDLLLRKFDIIDNYGQWSDPDPLPKPEVVDILKVY